MKPTAAELGGSFGSHGVKKALWIGVTMKAAAEYRTKAGGDKKRGAGASKKGDRWGKSINQIIKSGEIQQVPHDPKALRVVVNAATRDSKVYVLANPDEHGLCVALPITTEEVFYAAEYRDDNETNTQKFRAAITRKIVETLDDAQNQALAVNARPSQYHEKPPQIPLVGEARTILKLLQRFGDERDPKILEQIRRTIEAMSPDMAARAQFRDEEVLDRFLDPNHQITDSELEKVCNVLKGHFPEDAGEVTSIFTIKLLATAIRDKRVTVRYADLRFVLIIFHSKADSMGLAAYDRNALRTILEQTMDAARWFRNAKEVQGPEDLDEVANRDDLRSFAVQELRALERILEVEKAKAFQLQNIAGTSQTAHDLKTIMEKRQSTVDRDEDFFWNNELAGWMIRQLMIKFGSGCEALEDHTAQLRRDIQQYDEDVEGDDEEDQGEGMNTNS